jgi:hypothetical protein
MLAAGYTRCGAKASRKFYKNAFELPHVSGFLAAFSPITKQSTKLNMENFVSLRIVTLVLVTGYMLETTGADADVTFLGVAAGDANQRQHRLDTRKRRSQSATDGDQRSNQPRPNVHYGSHYIARRDWRFAD